MRIALFAVALLAAPAAAQTFSLIVSPDVAFKLKNAGPKALQFVDDQESMIVTPSGTASYQSHPFRTFTTINVMQGDGDNNSQLADTDRYGDLNSLMIRRRPPHAETGPFEPGGMWMSHSFNTTARVASTTGIVSLLDGDVYRCRNGKVEFFVKESVLAGAFAATGGNFDIDGMVQTPAGDLFFSFWDQTEVIGNVTYLDGDLLYIPASAITYDAAGLITAIKASSVQRFATESDITAMAVNSGAVDANGSPVTTIFDLAAIDLDPNGGTWTSPQNANLTGPNLIFASNTTYHLDNIWSTRNKGSLAVINGRTMGYTKGRADGSVLGIDLLPSQDAINAIALVPSQQHWIALDSPQSGTPVQGLLDVELGRLAPRSLAALFVASWTGDKPGGWVTATPFNVGLGGNRWLELDPFGIVPLVNVTADASGYAAVSFKTPANVPPGAEVLIQGVGLPFGSSRLSLSSTSNLTF